jgi:hypothetical protein
MPGNDANRPSWRMDRNTRIVMVTLLAALVAVVIVVVLRSRPTAETPVIQCGDGPRHLIDATQFETKYWGYSVKLEATISGKAGGGLTLDPKQVQQLSEAMQEANEVRKWLVNSYNACAMSQTQYDAYGMKYTDMDHVARRINDLARQTTGSPDAQDHLSGLVAEYIRLADHIQPQKGQ